MTHGIVLIVAQRDVCAGAVARALRAAGRDVVEKAPAELCDSRLVVRRRRIEIDGARVAGLLVRTPSYAQFGGGFRAADRSFVEAEVRAVLAAMMHSPSVRCINRVPPDVWLDEPHWLTFTRLFGLAGLPPPPIRIGGARARLRAEWVPISTGHAERPPSKRLRRLIAAPLRPERPIVRELYVLGKGSGVFRAAARRLLAAGIGVVEIEGWRNGRALAIDFVPAVEREDLIARIARFYAENG